MEYFLCCLADNDDHPQPLRSVAVRDRERPITVLWFLALPRVRAELRKTELLVEGQIVGDLAPQDSQRPAFHALKRVLGTELQRNAQREVFLGNIDVSPTQIPVAKRAHVGPWIMPAASAN